MSGISWPTVLYGLLNLIIGGLGVAFIRTLPTLKKLSHAREANLLEERAEEMESMRTRLAKLEAERMVDRHKLNNVTQCLEALLLMIELDPERAKEAAAKVKAMRADQQVAEAAESGAIHAAAINEPAA